MSVCCQYNICNDMKFSVIFHIKFDFFTPLFGELCLICFEKKFFRTDWKRLLYWWIDMSYKSQPKQTKKTNTNVSMRNILIRLNCVVMQCSLRIKHQKWIISFTMYCISWGAIQTMFSSILQYLTALFAQVRVLIRG